MRIGSYLLVAIGSIALTVAAWVGFQATRYFFFGLPIQAVHSRESGNIAVLRKHFGIIDYNLSVDVNGRSVYRSGDIQGFSPSDLRATLVWDKSGRVVVLEIMGKPRFAYDAVTNQQIERGGLAGLEFYPMPSDYPFTGLNE
jgi:hypothetical protein